MRVLQIVKTLDPTAGGVPVAVQGISSALEASGASVTICSLEPHDPRWISNLSGEVISFPRAGWSKLDYSWRLNTFVRGNIGRFDVVHSHAMYSASSAAILRTCELARTPFVISPHGMLAPYLRRRHAGRKWLAGALFHDRVLKSATRLHFTTDEERILAEPWSDPSRCMIVPLGVDVADLNRPSDPELFRSLVPAAHDKRVILYLGRLNFKKGLDLLVRAFAALVARHSDIHLAIVGPDDGMEREIRKLISHLNLQARITIVGMLQDEAKRSALQNSYIFALPSYTENFGIAVFEATAVGLPVAISDQVGVWREVKKHEIGLVSPCDVHAFEAQLSRLLDDEPLRARMSERARSYAARDLDWSRIGERFLAGYENALNATAAG